MTEPLIAFLWPESEFKVTGLTPPAGYRMRFGRSGDDAERIAACAGADYIVIMSGFGVVDAALLDDAPNCRLVQTTGAGYDTVDRAECERRGIPVANLPGLNAPTVAQMVLQLALRLCRPLPLLRTGGDAEWLAGRKFNMKARELTGRAGIVGYGHIGKQVAHLFAATGMEVVRAERAGQDDAAVQALPLDALLESCDVIAVTLPATPQTRGLIDARRVGLMKQGAILVNIGRGGIVDEVAVARGLAEGRFGGVAFDVFDQEPIQPDHPFFGLSAEARERLLLTPHIGGQTLDSKTRNFRAALENVLRVAKGERPLYELSPPC